MRCEISYSHPQKFLFFVVPKTGTRSMIKILQEHTSLSEVEAHGVPYDRSHWEGYFKFAFVRNPWERLVSCYFHKVRSKAWEEIAGCWGMTLEEFVRSKQFEEVRPQQWVSYATCWGKSFDDFVEWLADQDLREADIHFRLQTCLIPIEDLDYLGCFERYEEGVRDICAQLSIDDCVVPRLNPSKHDHYTAYYNDRTREMVGRLYRDDIDAFGYAFGCDEAAPIGLT